jgi:hypothetical protein
MTTKAFLISLMTLLTCICQSQPLVIKWQQCYGGSNMDGGYGALLKTSAGYMIFTGTASVDGQISGNHGLSDFALIWTDDLGNFQHMKCFGGSNEEKADAMKFTPDGGFVMFGYSESHDGDVQGAHGSRDLWVIKADSTGTIQWQRSLGGSSDDVSGYTFDIAPDSGFYFIGTASSNDGDVSGNHGYYDFWLTRLDKNGNLKWQKCFGGTLADFGIGVLATSDGGVIICGNDGSDDGNIDCYFKGGDGDAWILKLDSVGNIEWQKCYGGSGWDNISTILPTGDGGYLCAGNTTSNDGDVSGNHGNLDFWIIKIDQQGTLLWQKCFGGSLNENPFILKLCPDGNYLVGGYTYSNDGDVGGNHSLYPDYYDGWLIKITPSGTLLWQQCLGGIGNESIADVILLSGGNMTILSSSNTHNSSGDVHCNFHGELDAWLLSVTDTLSDGFHECPGSKGVINVYPNPANELVTFDYEFLPLQGDNSIFITDAFGRSVGTLTIHGNKGRATWNASRFPSGVYYYHVKIQDVLLSGKIILLK